MKLLTVPKVSPEDSCPYIDGNMECHEYFFAESIKNEEIDFLLSKGWRKFGQFLFRPRCTSCEQCIPLRVITKDFKISKSLRRVKNKNKDITVNFNPLVYNKEQFELYRKHSQHRFSEKQIENEDDFINTFYLNTGSQYMSEFRLDGKLVGFGILDQGLNSLSSVYFVFDPDLSKRSLGTYGAITEIEYAKDRGLDFYYLGYWIKDNSSMQYKATYKPHELYSWSKKIWK